MVKCELIPCNTILSFQWSQCNQNYKIELDSILSQSVLSFTIIKYWMADCTGDCTSYKDEHRNGRPIAVSKQKKKFSKKSLLFWLFDDSRAN